MDHDQLILTVSSKRRLEDELTHLRTVTRAEVTESIRKARSYGDLSENFEYHSARQAQAILNGRIAELEAVLEKATIVDDAAQGGDTVGLGSIVTIVDLETEEEDEYTIVDATSADPVNGKISYSSPVGQAVMKKSVGEIVAVALPNGLAQFRITNIRYA